MAICLHAVRIAKRLDWTTSWSWFWSLDLNLELRYLLVPTWGVCNRKTTGNEQGVNGALLCGGGRLTKRALPGRLQQLGGLLGDHGDPWGLRFMIDVPVGRAVWDDDQAVFLRWTQESFVSRSKRTLQWQNTATSEHISWISLPVNQVESLVYPAAKLIDRTHWDLVVKDKGETL